MRNKFDSNLLPNNFFSSPKFGKMKMQILYFLCDKKAQSYSQCFPAKTHKSFFLRKMPVQVFPLGHNKPKYTLKLFTGIKD